MSLILELIGTNESGGANPPPPHPTSLLNVLQAVQLIAGKIHTSFHN